MVLGETMKTVSRLLANAYNLEKPMPTSAGKTVKLPNSATLEEIQRRATRGEYGILSGILETLECEDSEYRGFCAKIREYAAAYDDEGIVQFIGLQDRKG